MAATRQWPRHCSIATPGRAAALAARCRPGCALPKGGGSWPPMSVSSTSPNLEQADANRDGSHNMGLDDLHGRPPLFAKPEISAEHRTDGSIILKSTAPLGQSARCVGDWL